MTLRPTPGSGSGPHALPPLTVSLPLFQATIETNCSGIRDVIGAICPVPFPSVRTHPNTVDVAFRADQSETNGNGVTYTILEGDVLLATLPAFSDAITYLEYLINSRALSAIGDQLVFHAGVVRRLEGAILFPASSRAGKSTLIAALCQSGFEYVSDELAIVDPVSRLVTPYLKAIRLRDGGWDALTAWTCVPRSCSTTVGTGSSTIRHFFPADFTPPDAQVPVRWICLPRREPGADASLNRLSRPAAFTELARHSLTLREHGPRAVDALARLVEGADCYSLVFDNIADAVAAIRAFAPAP